MTKDYHKNEMVLLWISKNWDIPMEEMRGREEALKGSLLHTTLSIKYILAPVILSFNRNMCKVDNFFRKKGE